MQINAIIIALLSLIALTLASTLEPRYTTPKIYQYNSTNCDGKGLDGPTNRLTAAKGHWTRGCYNMLPETHSVFLANGQGWMYYRKMTAFSTWGCNPSTFLTGISDRYPIGPCMPIDHIMDGVAGAERSEGRIMSIDFHKGSFNPNWGP